MRRIAGCTGRSAPLAAAHEEAVEVRRASADTTWDGRDCTGRCAPWLPSGEAAHSSPAPRALRLARTAPWQAMVDRSSSRRAASACVPPNSRMSCSTARASAAGSASESGAGTPRTASVAGPSADIAKPSAASASRVLLHGGDLERLRRERGGNRAAAARAGARSPPTSGARTRCARAPRACPRGRGRCAFCARM